MVAAKSAQVRSGGTGDGDRFRGWPTDAIEFFDELEMDNTKTFWLAHKELYQADVLRPMQVLVDELAPEFGQGRIFRPYRDTRFSADKSPYKTNIAAHNDVGYISLSSEALGVGSGLYMPSPDQLGRFRVAVADEKKGTEFVGIVGDLRRRRIQVSARETLKSAPRGYANDHPRIDLLRHKGLTAWKEWPVGTWLATTTPKKRIAEVLRATGPLRNWLDSNVGVARGS